MSTHSNMKEADSALALAHRMAGYIKDPAYIAAYVQREYGRTFPVTRIKAMQADHQRKREAFAKPRLDSRNNRCGDTGEPWRVRGVRR